MPAGSPFLEFVTSSIEMLATEGAELPFTLSLEGFLALYPDFVQRYDNVPNLLGIYVLGVPIEELMFASSFGSVWSIAYEYLQGYRLKSIAPMRFEHV
jgi:hypothetical protein